MLKKFNHPFHITADIAPANLISNQFMLVCYDKLPSCSYFITVANRKYNHKLL